MLNNLTINTEEDVECWRDNSIETAISAGIIIEGDAVEQMLRDTVIYINDTPIPQEMWTGRCYYHIEMASRNRQVEVEIYQKNLSNFDTPTIIGQLKDRGVPLIARLPISLYLASLPVESFKNFAGVTGMDHELIGHGYHYLTFQESGERAAIETQIRMIHERVNKIFANKASYPSESFSILEKLGYNSSWIVANTIGSSILYKHKKKDLSMGK